MAGSVDVIKMDEGEFGPFVLQIGDRTLRRLHGPFGMLDDEGPLAAVVDGDASVVGVAVDELPQAVAATVATASATPKARFEVKIR